MFKLFQHKISKSTKLLLLFFLFIPKGSNSEPKTNPDIDYKTVGIELDPIFPPSEDVAVVNKLCKSKVPSPFTMFALFDEDREAYFHTSSVTLSDQAITFNRMTIAIKYIYDVYTFWEGGLLLVAGFRYYYPGKDSLYKYFKFDKGKWFEVDGPSVGSEKSGFIEPSKMGLFLKSVSNSNKSNVPKQRDEYSTENNSRTMIVIASTVVGFLLGATLVGILCLMKN